MFRFAEAANAHERMSELERFIEFWYGPRQPEYGTPEPDLAALPPLPYPLRRFYAFAGQWPGPQGDHEEDLFYAGGAGHHLLTPDLLEVRDSDGRLRYFMEYQGDWDGLTLTEGEDPPVWIRGVWETNSSDDDEGTEETDDEDGEQEIQASDSLSKFLITHTLMATIYEDVNYAAGTWDDRLSEWFRAEPQNAVPLWSSRETRMPHYSGEFFLFHEHILVLQEHSSLRFAALHPEGVRRMNERLGR